MFHRWQSAFVTNLKFCVISKFIGRYLQLIWTNFCQKALRQRIEIKL